jgi:hypothetical protein
MKIGDFDDKRPILILEDFFQGSSKGWGIVQSRSGTLQRQFQIEAVGRWVEAERTLYLTETYRFDDGQIDRLEWRIRRLEYNRYEGNAFHWRYRRNVPSKDADYNMTFDDWFWLQPGDVLIARASLTKLGFEVGTMSVFYQKTSP